MCVCVYVCVCVCRSPRSSGGWSLTGTGVRLSVYLARERGREGGREGGREIGRSGVGVGEERERRKSCRVPSRVRVHRPPMCAKKRERERCLRFPLCVRVHQPARLSKRVEPLSTKRCLRFPPLCTLEESSHYHPYMYCVCVCFPLHYMDIYNIFTSSFSFSAHKKVVRSAHSYLYTHDTC